ncbi:MAG TPA: hypothetical protein VFR37_21565 [Longimicrobium sp.]|nr:hypothetical protein [Longimicrobium sp.]
MLKPCMTCHLHIPRSKMTNPSDAPVRAPRSLGRLLLATTALALCFPVLKWVALSGSERAAAGPVWVSFAAVMAVAGACVGAASYAARSHRLLHSYLSAVMIALLATADVQQFASMPLHTWLLRWVLTSLVISIPLGAIYHAIVWW